MEKILFKAEHFNATEEDLMGNNGIGRYIILPGSDGRAKEIAEHFENVVAREHPRGHNLYLGTLAVDGKKIEVASISSGMGCPSMEIILHELFNLGAKRFLRIGTAGSILPDRVSVGHLVNAQGSVRDENTTTHYAPIEVPAIASLEFTSSILLAAAKINLSDELHTGIVHCKSSLYAREFGAGPRSDENHSYMNLLSRLGILASEMETSALFILSQLYNYELMRRGDGREHRVLAGAILGIIGTVEAFGSPTLAKHAIKNAVELAIESVKTLAIQELAG